VFYYLKDGLFSYKACPKIKALNLKEKGIEVLLNRNESKIFCSLNIVKNSIELAIASNVKENFCWKRRLKVPYSEGYGIIKKDYKECSSLV